MQPNGSRQIDREQRFGPDWWRKIGCIILCLSCSSCFTSCVTTLPAGSIAALTKENRYVPYIPAQGDPRYQASWDRRGPGAILRKTAYEAEYFASGIVGVAQVKQITADAQNPESRIPFAALSNKRTKGWEFDGSGGWAFSNAAEISGRLGLESATTVDVKLGNVWVSEPFSYESLREHLQSRKRPLHRSTVNNLQRGRSFLVLKTVYADGIEIYFKTAKKGGADAGLKIPAAEAVKLGGKYTVTSDGGVKMAAPVIIGYVPVPQRDLHQILP